ncbi:MAG: phosphate ABC transporter permease subunit PstC [Clostridiaceae bacterium]|nr:phosphate ABC transporter permease subunit PstC [Clostridiaceae bacterium]
MYKTIDTIMRGLFKLSGLISALMIVLIILFVTIKGLTVFLPSYENPVDLGNFLTGMRWRADQQDYGVLFIIINTILSSFLAALIAFPLAVLSALMITKIAPKRLSGVLTTIVELLAAVPSVVYGVFASGVITSLVDNIASFFNYTTFGGNSMLAVVLLLAIMIYPTITSMAVVAINAVPESHELGSLALGASRTQTNFKVVLSSAKSGIFAGLILGLGRAYGEATAVSMVAGNAFVGPTWNPFGITRTLTSTMLSGMHETAGVDYDIRFSVGIILMIVILINNFLVNYIKRRIESGE